MLGNFGDKYEVIERVDLGSRAIIRSEVLLFFCRVSKQFNGLENINWKEISEYDSLEFKLRCCAQYITVDNLEQIFEQLDISFWDQMKAVKEILENAYDEEDGVSKIDAIRYMLKQYLCVDSDIVDINKLSKKDFKILIVNLIGVHYKLPTALTDFLKGCINQSFISFFNENDFNVISESKIYLNKNKIDLYEIKRFLVENKKELDYSFNDLSILPITIRNCKNLTSLNLSLNEFVDFPQVITELSNIKKLNFSKNKLTFLHPKILALQDLLKLNLSNNTLPSLPFEIGGLKKLKKLDLSKNKLIFLPFTINGLETLEKLNLSKNLLRELPPELDELVNLKKLNLVDSFDGIFFKRRT